MTRFAVLALVLGAFFVVFAACGKPAPTGPSVTTIQRASPPIPPPAPAEWIAKPSTGLEDLPPAERGAELAILNGCTACHTPDGEPSTGPTWQGIFGSREALEDGTTATVDAAYILESVRDPGLRVVKGFTPVMPVFDDEALPDDDVTALIAYIESLQ